MEFVTRIWDVEEGFGATQRRASKAATKLTSRIESKLKELISRSQ